MKASKTGMKKQKLELRLPTSSDTNKVHEEIKQAITSITEAELKSYKIDRPLGMTSGEIIISLVISLSSSVAVHVFREQIDAAARKLSKKLGVPILVNHEDKSEEGTKK